MENREYKSYYNDLIIKDIDKKKGIITGYASVFGNIDSDGDMIVRGAFTKTIKENGPGGGGRVVHLWQHKSDEPIGKPYVLKEDHYGLYFESQLITEPGSRGAIALNMYEIGVVNEHSIGFNTIKQAKKTGYNEINEVKLWEFSTVTWGANSLARAVSVKSLGVDPTSYIQSKRQNIYNAIRNGAYTDETFALLIKQLEYFDDELNLLLQDNTTQPEQEATTEPELKQEEVVLLQLITKNFNGI